MRIVSIVGARPEFVQVAVLSRALRRHHTEILIHTGQHYDGRMSDRFFEQLGIPKPDINLAVGSLSASAQTGEMIRGLAAAIAPLDADLVVVRGDTNSTLAGAIVAKQLLLPLAHIEAGMRSYDRTMPEEINRVVADHIADIQLVTDEAARTRLAGEGVREDVYVCGDVMYDVFLKARVEAQKSLPPELAAFAKEPYDLLTLHRAENTDDRERLRAIVSAFCEAPRRVLFPVHPRTAARLRDFSIELPATVTPTAPLGYLEIVALECGASTIFTDSGGVQREAYFARVPCVTLRDTTEWTNTIDAGWNRLVGASAPAIRAALHAPPTRPVDHPSLFGDGDAAHHIVAALETPQSERIVATARATRVARGYAAAPAV
ncbi:MAG: UDP-N-acetylglucosamine 2-epimerase (non-hydrolyzing) [Candidatus Eremiobacteraeota bacterium]|nr:UDP-N-acetylglucosamine 2-epimerase (non-hydrolyzing) [Candidatus Eremiobacteraeota bacterium]